MNYFLEMIKESNEDTPFVNGVVFHSLLDYNDFFLSAHIILQKLDFAASQCDGNKSLVLDGDNV